jgi:hypothetical protein
MAGMLKPHNRMSQRIAGYVRKRIAEARFEDVPDLRDSRGKRWSLQTVLSTVVVGILSGAKSCAQLEARLHELESHVMGFFGIPKPLPDTTARTILCRVEPEALRPALHRVVYAAARRKALRHEDLPFGIVSLDGKGTAVPTSDGCYAQNQTQGDGPLRGVIRTVTATLCSSPARPVIDVTPIPAHTNEMGWFQEAFTNLLSAYKRHDFFRLVTYDAGATSLANATFVRDSGVHYVLGVKGTQPELLREAKRLLKSRKAADCNAETTDADGTVRRLYIESIDGWDSWTHAKVLIRVSSASPGEEEESRYFVSSLPVSRLTMGQWLRVIRLHWGVEISHQCLDVAFEEDERPWIEACPRGTVVVAILRRIAYTILTLFRSVTLRSDENRNAPWATLIRAIELTLLRATSEQLKSLRVHALPAPS